MGRRGGGTVSTGKRDDYRLLSVVEAFASINQWVSLVGVIVEHSPPRRSKGTDYCCSVRIVDASHHTRGLLVNFFAESEERLPTIESAGDIIQLSHVVMKAYNKEIYALFSKKFSAFAIYEGKYGESLVPYQVSPKFHSREDDKEFVAGLRKWMDTVQLDTVSKESVLLREIRKGERLDLVCKILHIHEAGEDELMLFIWDGTDAPRCHIQGRIDSEKESPLSLQLECQRLSSDVLSKFPTVGTVLRVKVEQRKGELHLSSVVVGRWVKFTNLTFEVHAGLWYGILGPCTRIRFVPDEDRLVVKCLSDFEERFSSKWDRMPFTSFPWPPHLTETEKEDVALVTLMDIINFSEVTAKFKCVVRVVAMLPSNPKDFRSPDGTYRIRLTLEDPTARIHAFLYGDDAEMFFDGYPSIDDLTRKRNKFLGLGEADGCSETQDTLRNPPWMICCIKSYYVDKSRPWETRNYRVFGTRLLC